MSSQAEQTGNQKWLVLGVVSLAEMLAISPWLVSSAISDQVQTLWSLSTWQTSALATAVQFGFVVGTLASATLNLADIWPNRIFFAACAIGAAIGNLCMIACTGFLSAALTRFFVGICMAGVYPPAMKMIATWFQSSRGLAIGTLIGALTIGKAVPFLLKTFQISQWQTILVVASVAALIGGVLVAGFYREGPFVFAKKPFNLALVSQVARHRETRLAIFGYLGHMWELYAMWTCIGVFITFAANRFGFENQAFKDAIIFSVIGIGAIGCTAGGWMADRFGRERFVNLAMAISGACCLLIGFCLGIGFWACVVVAWVWGFFVVADSAQFSTIVTEVTPQHAVGTALTLQTCVGFLLTTITIQLVPWLEQRIGWEFAFAILALGPVFGITSVRRLATLTKN